MPARAIVKRVLVVGAVAVLVVLAIHLLRTGETQGPGESGAVPLGTADDAGASGPSRGVDANVRVSTSPLKEGDGLPTNATVEGTVCDAGGTPLAEVRITARLLEGPPAASAPSETTTNARGTFALALPLDASAELAFSCSGYRPIRQIVHVPSRGLDVVLERSPTLRGRVVRRDGTAVAGALVRWSHLFVAVGAGTTTTTGTDGRFAFVDVPKDLDLEVLAPEALPVYRWIRVTWAMGELVITLDGGREATGTVLDAGSGTGIAGASVELWYYGSTYTDEGRRAGAAQQAETVKTRGDGSFTLTRLPSTPDRRRPDTCLWVTAPGHAPHWTLVPSPERADGLKVTLYPAGSVRGRVVDASGAPVPGQRVYAEAKAQLLCDAGPNHGFRGQDCAHSILWNTRRPEAVAPFHTEREAFTDSAGAYLIEGIPCPAGGGEVAIALPAGDPVVTVVARPAEAAVAADLVLPEGLFRRWHGVVHDEYERPVGGATIELSICRTVSDTQGRFEVAVPGDTQGKLSLRASAPGYVPCDRIFVPSHGLFCECEEGGVTITLTRAVRLAVLVVDHSQRPVPDACVQFFPEGGLADFAKGARRPLFLGERFSDDRGAVLLVGVPATCDVLVEYLHRNGRTHRRILEAVAAGAGSLRVVLEDLDLSADTASLTVRVMDGRTDAAFSGQVLVEATSDNGAECRLLPGPEICLEGLSLGTWEVRVAAEGLGARSARVELRDDRRLDVRLGQGAAISGMVTGTRPLPRPVQVHAREVASKRVTVAHTDAAGSFAFAGMETGDYLLSVDPFESAAFAGLPVRRPQSHASLAPVKVRVAAGTVPAPVMLPVVPVAPLTVVVAPDAATRAAGSLWSWAQGLHFTVADERGKSVYAGGLSDLMATAARLLLCLPEGCYTVTVRRRGEVLGERALAAGESWRLDAR